MKEKGYYTMEVLIFITGAIFGASICGLCLLRSFKKTNNACVEKIDGILKKYNDK